MARDLLGRSYMESGELFRWLQGDLRKLGDLKDDEVEKAEPLIAEVAALSLALLATERLLGGEG